jgi:uncharacterized protein
MQMTGEYRIQAPRETVWRALNDPDILRSAIPGCEAIEKVSDVEFTAKVSLTVGPVRAKFSGRVTLSDLNPPKSYTIAGEGQGGVAGFGKGSAKVELDEEGPNLTVLRYSAQAQVGGKLAQIGSRLVDATAKKLADEFFGRFAAAVAPAPAPVEEAILAPVPEAVGAPAMIEPAMPSAPPPRPALKPIVWIPLLIGVIAILWWLVARS